MDLVEIQWGEGRCELSCLVHDWDRWQAHGNGPSLFDKVITIS
jgi:hypothetical protein